MNMLQVPSVSINTRYLVISEAGKYHILMIMSFMYKTYLYLGL